MPRTTRTESRDQLFNALDRKLGDRPDREELQRTNIIQDSRHTSSGLVDRGLHQTIRALASAQRETKLDRQLSNRETVEALFNRNILLSKGNPSSAKVVVTQRQLQKLETSDTLQDFLQNRPTLDEIVLSNEHIVQDTMTWSKAVMSSSGHMPVPRNCHSMTHIAEKNSLFLIGGYGSAIKQSELLVLNTDTQTWSRPTVGGECPQERYSHTCSAVGTQLILFGGFSKAGEWLQDLHVLDTDSNVPFFPKLGPLNETAESIKLLMWYQPRTKGQGPCPRAAHSSSVIGKHVYIFAGNDGQNLFNDLFRLDTETMSWSQPETKGQAPPPRAGHSATVVGTQIVVFGGGIEGGMANDLYILDTETLTWTCPETFGTPPAARAGHAACCVFGRHVLVFGGGSIRNKAFNDLHLFSVDTLAWSRPSDTGDLPVPRAGHSCTMVGTRLFAFAGGDDQTFFNDLHVLDTAFLRVDQAKKKMASTARNRSFSVETLPDMKAGVLYNDNVVRKVNETSRRIQQYLSTARQELTDTRKQREAETHHAITSMCSNLLATLGASQKSTFADLNARVDTLEDLVVQELLMLREAVIQTIDGDTVDSIVRAQSGSGEENNGDNNGSNEEDDGHLDSKTTESQHVSAMDAADTGQIKPFNFKASVSTAELSRAHSPAVFVMPPLQPSSSGGKQKVQKPVVIPRIAAVTVNTTVPVTRKQKKKKTVVTPTPTATASATATTKTTTTTTVAVTGSLEPEVTSKKKRKSRRNKNKNSVTTTPTTPAVAPTTTTTTSTAAAASAKTYPPVMKAKPTTKTSTTTATTAAKNVGGTSDNVSPPVVANIWAARAQQQRAVEAKKPAVKTTTQQSNNNSSKSRTNSGKQRTSSSKQRNNNNNNKKAVPTTVAASGWEQVGKKKKKGKKKR